AHIFAALGLRLLHREQVDHLAPAPHRFVLRQHAGVGALFGIDPAFQAARHGRYVGGCPHAVLLFGRNLPGFIGSFATSAHGSKWHLGSFRGDAFGAKRTFSEPRFPNRIYEYAPWMTGHRVSPRWVSHETVRFGFGNNRRHGRSDFVDHVRAHRGADGESNRHVANDDRPAPGTSEDAR